MRTARQSHAALRAAWIAFGATLLLLIGQIARSGGQSIVASTVASSPEPRMVTSVETEDLRADSTWRIHGDPFALLRTAPEVPYRIGAATVTGIVPQPRSAVRLLGTVVRATGRSFAMCQVAGEVAKVVYPGQTIGGLTLESVQQGSAVFTDETGTRVTMRVARTGE